MHYRNSSGHKRCCYFFQRYFFHRKYTGSRIDKTEFECIISNTLQVMERKGLIVRTAVSQDARLKKLNLTENAFMETLRRIHRNPKEELQNSRREN